MTEYSETPEQIEASLKKREQFVMNSDAAGWQKYIDATAKKAEQRAIDLTIEVVGEALGEALKTLRAEFKAALELEVTKIRNEFLADRLDEARGVKRSLKVVPTDSMVG